MILNCLASKNLLMMFSIAGVLFFAGAFAVRAQQAKPARAKPRALPTDMLG